MNYLLSDISRSRLTIPFSVLGGIAAGMLLLFGDAPLLGAAEPLNPIWNALSSLSLHGVGAVLINLALVMLTGWGLFKMNETFALSHFRSTLPFLFYLLFQLSNPGMQFISQGSFAAVLIPVALFVLFSSYQAEKPAPYAFLTGVTVGALSLVWSDALLYFPVFIVGLSLMRSLRMKSFLAALIGLVALYWLQFSFYFFKGDLTPFVEQFAGVGDFSLPRVSELSLATQIHFVLTLLIGIISGTKLLISNLQEKVRTQACYNFVILLSTVASALVLFDSGNATGHLTIMYLTIALLVGDIFTASSSKMAVALFFTIIASYSALLGWFLMG